MSLVRELERTPSLSHSDGTATTESDDLNSIILPTRPIPNAFNRKQNQKLFRPPPSALNNTKASRTFYRSSFHRPNGLVRVVCHPRILDRLLLFISFDDFHSLSAASRIVRRIMLDPHMKDIVFSNFIPGYRIALKTRDRRFCDDQIRLDYGDLSILSKSLFLATSSPLTLTNEQFPLFTSQFSRNAFTPIPHARLVRPLQ